MRIKVKYFGSNVRPDPSDIDFMALLKSSRTFYFNFAIDKLSRFSPLQSLFNTISSPT